MVRTAEKLAIVILEDNQDRRDAMAERFSDRLPQYDVVFAATSAECIDWLHRKWSTLLAISLDHDLEPIAREHQRWIDAGTGRDVAEFLAEQTPVCPVVIHSTNVPASAEMQQQLEQTGWSVSRIIPYGDLEWVSQDWFPAIRQAMDAWVRQPGNSVLPGGGSLPVT